MKVLVSLPVHESRRVIEDQVRNLTYFFEDVTILLHLSQSYSESPDFGMFSNVVVNPTRYPTRWGNIVYLHYANIQYAFERRIPFEYVVFCSSNELYIRKGVERYLKTADAFLDPRGVITSDGRFTFTTHPRSVFYARTAVIDKAFSDGRWHAFLDRHGVEMVKSQIEGSAYSRRVVRAMVAMMKREFGLAYLQDLGWCGEEILLPTVFLAVRKNRELRVKRQFSFVDWCHDFTPGMWKRAIRHWRGRRDKGIARYLDEIDASEEIYAIKGVKRTYYNPVRNYVRKLLPKHDVDTRGYLREDVRYNWDLAKKNLRPRTLVLSATQGALGVASRLAGKPKGYLKWKLRERTASIRKHL